MVTGGAGFIGSHLCERLVGSGHEVVAVDSFDPFYPAAVKRRNLALLLREPAFRLLEVDVRRPRELCAALRATGVEGVDLVVHLAARAGVRSSIQEPVPYSDVNVTGTAAMLEVARELGATGFIFGSSSSVYGNNGKVPFAEDDPVDRPISPYAATKRAGELLCHSHAHLYGMATVCLRFFTVYGPRQRPDLAIHKFSRLMLAGRGIPIYGDGTTERDYTFVDDILRGVEGAIRYASTHPGCFEIVNLGEGETVPLWRLVELLGRSLGVEPRVERHPPQPGDVARTFADISKARRLFGYAPATRVDDGIPQFVAWLRGDRAAAKHEDG